MNTPKCYTWLESYGSPPYDGKKKKLFFSPCEASDFRGRSRTDFLHDLRLRRRRQGRCHGRHHCHPPSGASPLSPPSRCGNHRWPCSKSHLWTLKANRAFFGTIFGLWSRSGPSPEIGTLVQALYANRVPRTSCVIFLRDISIAQQWLTQALDWHCSHKQWGPTNFKVGTQ